MKPTLHLIPHHLHTETMFARTYKAFKPKIFDGALLFYQSGFSPCCQESIDDDTAGDHRATRKMILINPVSRIKIEDAFDFHGRQFTFEQATWIDS